ncbi:hypothetical protein ACFGVR_02270 [Mucilaginibacter sp. AW1-3]
MTINMEEYQLNIQTTGLRAKQVANRMVITTSSLINLLRGLGFTVEQKGNFELNHEHLHALAQNYIRGIHQISLKTKRRIAKGRLHEQDYLRIFYFFLKDHSPEYLSLSNSEQWELDHEKMESFFYRLIFSPRTRTDKGSKFFNKIIRYMQARLAAPLLDIKSLLLSKISPTLFFNYPNEEDHHVSAGYQSGFSVAKICFTLEALVNQFNTYKRNVRHEKNNTFNTENTRMQFVC